MRKRLILMIALFELLGRLEKHVSPSALLLNEVRKSIILSRF